VACAADGGAANVVLQQKHARNTPQLHVRYCH
jgi:hypothetical protein